ncbi:MAG: phospho-N-acetylmuramoyl-pentapeptide-transferase [Candidatus Falkowbacteria bacterium]
MTEFQIIRILVLSTLAFVFTMAWTPLWTKFLYKYKMGKQIRNTGATPVFSALHAAKSGTPTMGGVLIWGTVLIFSFLFYYLSLIFPKTALANFNFLSRPETYLPLGALVASALVGLFDDWLDVRGKGVKGGGGLNIKHRLLIYTAIAAIGAWWFHYKLLWEHFSIPFVGTFQLGPWYLLIFIFVIVATSFSVNESDGLDGLAGGVLLTCFSSYAVIGFVLGHYHLAAFCGVIVGALLAFLWFNITPARFYLGDTGSMSLGVTLGVIAMLTDTAMILPVIGLVFVIETLSVIIQLTSKKLRHGKKVFLSAPIHHHLEAIGWSEAKIVMRFWVIAGVCGALGLALFILDKLY